MQLVAVILLIYREIPAHAPQCSGRHVLVVGGGDSDDAHDRVTLTYVHLAYARRVSSDEHRVPRKPRAIRENETRMLDSPVRVLWLILRITIGDCEHERPKWNENIARAVISERSIANLQSFGLACLSCSRRSSRAR